MFSECLPEGSIGMYWVCSILYPWLGGIEYCMGSQLIIHVGWKFGWSFWVILGPVFSFALNWKIQAMAIIQKLVFRENLQDTTRFDRNKNGFRSDVPLNQSIETMESSYFIDRGFR